MNKRIFHISIHAAFWIVMFLSPLMFANRNSGINWSTFIDGSMMPLLLCVIFYINYFIIVPTFLLKDKQREYFIINIVLVAIFVILMQLWMNVEFVIHKPENYNHVPPPVIFFIFRDIFTTVLSIGIAAAIRMSVEWGKSEQKRKEIEIKKTEVELKNLRNQINPHFLLNTLNNIYALIAFDTKKAQWAVMELSKLLRHILYDNQQYTVNLSDEVKFITTYINLMRIRTHKNVEISVNINIPEPCTHQIAPLIFISLIENAFKHGISPTLPSFIHVYITADSEQIECKIENSNYPKPKTDKSGHGVGLEQVKRRLELSYQDSHEWIYGVSEDGKIYSSKIIIYDSKMCNR